MKKILLSLAAVVMACIGAKAETASVTFSSMGYSNAQVISSVEVPNSPITLSLSKGSGSSDPAFYTSGNDLRVYKSNTLKVSVPEGYLLNKVVFTATSASYKIESTYADKGSMTVSGSATTWTGEDTEFTITNKTTGKTQIRLTKIDFEYVSTAAKEVEDVEISYVIQEDNTALVTLSCATEGASIYYGTDGEAFSELYTAPFPVSENCTIYARAEKGEEKSLVKSLAIVLPYTSFKEAVKNGVNGEDITIVGNFGVITQATNYLLLTDGTSNILVYGSQSTYAQGTAISKIVGKVSTAFGDLFEITEATLTEGGEGASIEPVELSAIKDVINYNDNLFDLVVLRSCNISGKNKNAANISFGAETIALYNNLGLTFTNGENKDITGFVWRNKDILQICPMIIEDGEEFATVETPVISPNKTELKFDELVRITCATPDVTIYYTTDGSDPTQDSEKYTEPITFTQNVTIKARAFYENDDVTMHPSEIAKRTYSVFNPYCNIITVDGHHEEAGMSYLSYTEHSCVIDDVEYTMNAAHNRERGLQMTNTTDRLCYVIQSSDNEGLAIDGIEIDFNLSGTNNNAPKFIVRASNTPFQANKESITSDGVYIGEINGDNTSVTFAKDYNYFALYLDVTKAIYMNSITINYRDPKEVDMTEVPTFGENFTIVSDENGFITDKLPYHENWNLKYQVNDGDENAFEYDDDNDGLSHEEELAAASLHTLKIWFEHYYHGTASEPVVFNHVTEPQFVVKNSQPSEDGESVCEIEIPTIGEGVNIYFTLNGQEPVINTEDEPAAQARRPRAVAGEDGVYTLDSAEDLEATHSISAGTSKVIIRPLATSATGSNFVLKAKAVHAATGATSGLKSSDVFVDISTGINEIEAAANEAVYFNLQGVRVANPENGTYIRVANGKADKVIVK